MTKESVICLVLGVAVIITLFSVLGLVMMKEVFQKVHFSTPIVGLGFPLIILALWIQTHDDQARLKSLLIMVVLFLMNGVLNHAMARAQRIRKTGHWELRSDEKTVERPP